MTRLGQRWRRGQRVGLAALLLATGGAWAASPDTEGADNLLSEPSFESAAGLGEYWQKTLGAGDPDGQAPSVVGIEEGGAHSGSRCLVMSGDAGTTTWSTVISPAVEAASGERYRLRGWMKTQDVRREGRQYLNCNLFIQFLDGGGQVLRISGYPVLGTEALTGSHNWTLVERVVPAPAGCRQVKVGCFLSCSGKAWFDDISLVRLAAADWKEEASDRFVVYCEGDEQPQRRAVRGNEKNLVEMERLLGVEGPKQIPFYKYASNERKGELTGNAGNAHVEGGAIHSVFWSDRHEIVHILTQPWGETTALWGEGVAVYLSGGWQGKPVHEAAGALQEEGKLLPLAGIIKTADFRSHPDLVTYGQAGSFVKYLVDAFGWAKFKEIYPAGGPNDTAEHWADKFHGVYGKSLEAIEADWRAGLRPAGMESGEK